MSGKRRKAGPRAYARLTRHEREMIQTVLNALMDSQAQEACGAPHSPNPRGE